MAQQIGRNDALVLVADEVKKHGRVTSRAVWAIVEGRVRGDDLEIAISTALREHARVSSIGGAP